MIRGFPPVVGRLPRALVLGTAPSVLSLREGRYYAHPRNDFWPIMERLFADGRRLDYAGRLALLEGAGVALWDVLATAERAGSLDSNIAAPVPNDIGGLICDHPSIRAVFFNGAAAERLFAAHIAPSMGSLTDGDMRVARLPSTSPANASISFALKLAAWAAVRVAVKEPSAPAS